MRVSLHDVEQAIARFRPEEQRRLLAELPRLLKLPQTDLAYLKLAEPSFEFWENPDDAIYDTL
jgi:hypothetical protein